MPRIKITKPIYIRKGPGTNYESLGVVYPSGKDLIVDGKKPDGEVHKGISGWYHKTNDKGELQWYWEGGTKESSYNDKKKDFLDDNSMAIIHRKTQTEVDWKVGWGHVDIEVWRLWGMQYKGKGVRVAVLDSGINTNIKDITDAVDDLSLDLRSFVPGEGIGDDSGHGTECASILAARGKNMLGISPECDLIIGKIESSNFGKNPKTTLAALRWACEERNADIISMSFSVPSRNAEPQSIEEKDVADYILKMHTERDKLFVASIGNLGEKAKDRYSFPANYKGCISIAGYDQSRKVWPGSSWNKNITFTVPCVNLKGYSIEGNVKVLSPATSYACPFAAGVLANLLSVYRKNKLLFNARNFLESLVFDIPPEYDPIKFGKGIIDIYESYNKII